MKFLKKIAYFEKTDGITYLHLFNELLEIMWWNDWEQLWGRYNWINITVIKFAIEKDNQFASSHVELGLFGFNTRISFEWGRKDEEAIARVKESLEKVRAYGLKEREKEENEK